MTNERATFLSELIDKQVAATVIATLSRKIDHIAEEMAEEILRDEEFKRDVRTLARESVKRILEDLTAPKK